MKLAAAMVALLAACSGSDPSAGGPDAGGDDADAQQATGELVLGGADDTGASFVELPDGSDATLIAGAQGGYHVWTRLRAHSMEGELRVVYQARRVSDGVLVLSLPERELMVPHEAMQDWWEEPDPTANFMCPTPIGIQVYDQEIEYTVQVTTVDGSLVGEARITRVPRCPAGDEQNCHDRCSG
jgi:hypothetical protein